MKGLSTGNGIMIAGLAIAISITMASDKFYEMEQSVDYNNAIKLTEIILENDRTKIKRTSEKIDLYVSTYEKVLDELNKVE